MAYPYGFCVQIDWIIVKFILCIGFQPKNFELIWKYCVGQRHVVAVFRVLRHLLYMTVDIPSIIPCHSRKLLKQTNILLNLKMWIPENKRPRHGIPLRFSWTNRLNCCWIHPLHRVETHEFWINLKILRRDIDMSCPFVGYYGICCVPIADHQLFLRILQIVEIIKQIFYWIWKYEYLKIKGHAMAYPRVFLNKLYLFILIGVSVLTQ